MDYAYVLVAFKCMCVIITMYVGGCTGVYVLWFIKLDVSSIVK